MRGRGDEHIMRGKTGGNERKPGRFHNISRQIERYLQPSLICMYTHNSLCDFEFAFHGGGWGGGTHHCKR